MHFEIDVIGDRITIVSSGLWDSALLSDASYRFRAAIDQFARTNRQFDLLSDLRDYPTQTQVVAQGAQELVELASRSGLRRCAQVLDSALARSQMRRLSDGDPRYRFFIDVAEAKAWLDAPD